MEKLKQSVFKYVMEITNNLPTKRNITKHCPNGIYIGLRNGIDDDKLSAQEIIDIIAEFGKVKGFIFKKFVYKGGEK